jgi:hypothetical protein
MTARSSAKVGDELYAIVRLDSFTAGAAGVTIRAVLASQAEAEAEVRRLNGRAPSGTTYFCQTAKFTTGTPPGADVLAPARQGLSRAPSARPSPSRRRPGTSSRPR